VIYPENFEQKIGFEKIILQVKNMCLSELGRLKAGQIKFSNKFNKIQQQLELTNEFLQLIQFGKQFPSQDYYDLIPELQRIHTEGTFIEIEKMGELRLSYLAICEIIMYFTEEQDSYPQLFKQSQAVITIPEINTAINRILDDKGYIKDNASEPLRKIRSDIISTQILIEKRIRQIFQGLKREGIINEDVEITMRNGRCVIPVSSASKRKVKGFIHDESSSGQTVFIEPSEIFELNNSLRELETAEKKEIIKILKQFTDFLRPFLPDLIDSYNYLGDVDLIRAKAMWANWSKSIKPQLTKGEKINWSGALNPLLEQHLKTQGKSVVPFDLTLDPDQRILVISGPNAGGKSVCLKTVGLLQYMLQTGFLVPVNPNSEFGIFSNVFLEIGDEQSIENDLSTYSSHLKNLKFFAENAGKDTLFLIDEFGSGTEPLLGGAIAEATLLALNEKNAFGVVSTHYSNLKELAAKTNGIINGSMLFDVKNLLPLYKLLTGNSGSSYAFEIAEKIGFPSDIIAKAITLAGEEKITFEKQLQKFESDKEELIKQQEKIKMADDFFADMIDKYQKLLSEIESDKKNIYDTARKEAALLIQKANSAIEKTIKQIKESNADKQITLDARIELKTFEEKVVQAEPEVLPEPKSSISKKPKLPSIRIEKKVLPPPQKGSYVKIPGQNVIGEIKEIKNKQATVLYNNLTMNIPVEKLETVNSNEFQEYLKKKTKNNYSELYNKIHDKVSDFKNTIDVRGCRAEAVYAIIEKQIDDAVLLRNFEFSILHGKGTGVLRRVIREILSSHPDVISYGDERIENGGDGITIVKLK
jgi:DNA mismatch repair protein MutS2